MLSVLLKHIAENYEIWTEILRAQQMQRILVTMQSFKRAVCKFDIFTSAVCEDVWIQWVFVKMYGSQINMEKNLLLNKILTIPCEWTCHKNSEQNVILWFLPNSVAVLLHDGEEWRFHSSQSLAAQTKCTWKLERTTVTGEQNWGLHPMKAMVS